VDALGDEQRMLFPIIATCAHPVRLLILCRLGKMEEQIHADFPSWLV
jgi:hypothetical protein